MDPVKPVISSIIIYICKFYYYIYMSLLGETEDRMVQTGAYSTGPAYPTIPQGKWLQGQ